MDPLSTIANVITLVEFSVKLQELVSRWRDAPEYVRHVEGSVRDMKTVIQLITDKSENASAASEDKIYVDTIGNFAETCSRLVRELYEILSPLEKSVSSRDKIRLHFIGMLKERDINSKRVQIQEYTTKLTLLLASLNSKKSTRIETALQEITRKLDEFLTLPPYTSVPEANTILQEDSSSADGFEFLLDDAPPKEPGERRRPSLLDGIEIVELGKMKQKVQESQSKKMFRKAAQYQQKVIEMVKSQVDGQSEDDICDLQEQHADLLLECSSPACLHEATIILSDALQRQKERAHTNASSLEQSLKQQGRLMSKLAKLYRDGDGLGDAHNPKKSESFFTNSIIYLSRLTTFLANDFLTVGAAMVLFHKENLELQAELKRRVLSTMKQRAPEVPYDWDQLTSVQEQSVRAWCREQGFKADQLRFRFDTIQDLENGNTSPLHLAVQEGETEIVKKMLVEVEDVDLLDESGMTPLLLAAQKRQSKIAQVLLEYHASVKRLMPDKRTALHLCLDDNDSEGGVNVTKCLLDQHSELVDQKDREGKTALHFAVLKSHRRIAKLLLKRKADPNLAEENGKTPLLMAVESRVSENATDQNSLRPVKTFDTTVSLNSSTTWNTTSSSPRSSETSQRPAAESTPKRASRASIITLLLENGANPTIADNTDNLPLHSACKRGDIDTVKLLLKKWPQTGTFVNQKGPMDATPIIIAVKGQHESIVKELIRWGANSNFQDRTAHSAEDYARKLGARKYDLLLALRHTGK